MKQKQEWITDASNKSNNKRYQTIKLNFQQALQEQANDPKINYYDFLLVAKKLGFRFQESAHLMSLKNYFAKNKNVLLIKRLVDLLCISADSIFGTQDKMQKQIGFRVVKFTVPQTHFQAIKEATNEDEENYNSEDQQLGGPDDFGQLGNPNISRNEAEVNDKINIILSIKVEQMSRKIKALTNQSEDPNIFSIFSSEEGSINFETFRKGVLFILGQIRARIKLSEDDIKTIFVILDKEQKNQILVDNLQILRTDEMLERMKAFYYTRINREMVKNTMFKLGRAKDSGIQVFQLKNASVLQFKQMEESMVNQKVSVSKTVKQQKRIPHFGPLKGATRLKKANHPHNLRSANSLDPHLNKQLLQKERQKIERILRSSKQQKKREKGGQTVASKLRSLFIHKVILPRQRMLAEQKDKLHNIKKTENQLAIKPLK